MANFEQPDIAKEKKEKDEGLSAGWKAVGAVSLGLLLGGKFHKLGILGGGLNEKEVQEIEGKGGWLNAVVDKSAQVYRAFERIEEISDEYDFENLAKDFEDKINGASNKEERQRINLEFEEIKKSREKELAEREASKKARNKIFQTLSELRK